MSWENRDADEGGVREASDPDCSASAGDGMVAAEVDASGDWVLWKVVQGKELRRECAGMGEGKEELEEMEDGAGAKKEA
jgi:hypothetical protein